MLQGSLMIQDNSIKMQYRSVCGCVCRWVCECVLPEVGDLLLSISMDCWLSESSVRPVKNYGEEPTLTSNHQ